MRSSSETLLDWWKKLEQMLCTFMVLEVWRSCQWVATDVDSITKEARMFTSEQDFKEDLHWLLNQEVMVLRESQPIWSLKFWSLWFILALVSGEIKHRITMSVWSAIMVVNCFAVTSVHALITFSALIHRLNVPPLEVGNVQTAVTRLILRLNCYVLKVPKKMSHLTMQSRPSLIICYLQT